MAWLLRQGEVLASVEVAATARERARGFLGRRAANGALLLTPLRIPHTVGVRFPLDVAYLDDELVVVSTRRMAPFRVGWPRRHCRAVLEVDAGAFERWRLKPGDRLEIEA